MRLRRGFRTLREVFYWCRRCGFIFDRPESFRGVLDSKVFRVCPRCGCGDFVEVDEGRVVETALKVFEGLVETVRGLYKVASEAVALRYLRRIFRHWRSVDGSVRGYSFGLMYEVDGFTGYISWREILDYILDKISSSEADKSG